MSLMLGQFQAPSRGKGPGAGGRGQGPGEESGGGRGALGGGWGSARLGGAVGNGEEALLGGGHVPFWRSDLSSVKRGGGAALLPLPPAHPALALARAARGLAQRGAQGRACGAESGSASARRTPCPLRSKPGGSKRAQSQ